MEKIISIKEVFNVTPEDHWNSFEGYEIVTDQQKIQFLISDGQSCCEDAGYLCSNDNIEEFIGAELKSITKTDTALTTKAANMNEYGYNEGGIIFINLETDKGTLQFAVYNSHNGYYGHSVLLKSNQLDIADGL